MPYCTERNMIDRFGETELVQITDDNNDDAINTDKLGRAIADASAQIDGYIGSRYTLPLAAATTPEVLVKFCCDMARFALFDDQVTDLVQKRYDDAIKFLMKVAEGKATLGIDEAGEDQAGGKVAIADGVSKHDWDKY